MNATHRAIIAFAAMAGLAGCTAAQVATVETDVAAADAKGQLFCQKATILGPLVVALATTSGVPVTATNNTAEVVAAACAAINAVPVPAPAAATVPVVTVPSP